MLAEHTVHVWPIDLAPGAAEPGGGIEVLSPAERARAARFRFDRDRGRWIAARAGLRRVLADASGVRPHEIVIAHPGPRAKPFLVGDAGSWLRFNLAHSGDVALVAIGVGLEVGVDVEAVRDDAASRRDLLAISERVLGPDITKDLEQAPIDERVRRFSLAWVRHEARAKCHGEGLVDASVAAAAPADDAVSVFDLDVGDGYAAALAVGGTPRAVRRWEAA